MRLFLLALPWLEDMRHDKLIEEPKFPALASWRASSVNQFRVEFHFQFPPELLGHGRLRIACFVVKPSSRYMIALAPPRTTAAIVHNFERTNKNSFARVISVARFRFGSFSEEEDKMSSMVARTGRLRQRYEDNLRLVSGCIPYRLVKDGEYHRGSIESRVEVLMVSSPNRDDLVFPKGGWEDDETVEEAACREALEEAGVRGLLQGTPLGVWEFRSKSRQDVCSLEGGCRGYMFSLEVTEELEDWPEQENRCRRWVNVKDAFKLCRYEWMRQALESFLGMLGKEAKLESIGDSLQADVVTACCLAAA